MKMIFIPLLLISSLASGGAFEDNATQAHEMCVPYASVFLALSLFAEDSTLETFLGDARAFLEGSTSPDMPFAKLGTDQNIFDSITSLAWGTRADPPTWSSVYSGCFEWKFEELMATTDAEYP